MSQNQWEVIFEMYRLVKEILALVETIYEVVYEHREESAHNFAKLHGVPVVDDESDHPQEMD